VSKITTESVLLFVWGENYFFVYEPLLVLINTEQLFGPSARLPIFPYLCFGKQL
jgi:hypothetical protein